MQVFWQLLPASFHRSFVLLLLIVATVPSYPIHHCSICTYRMHHICFLASIPPSLVKIRLQVFAAKFIAGFKGKTEGERDSNEMCDSAGDSSIFPPYFLTPSSPDLSVCEYEFAVILCCGPAAACDEKGGKGVAEGEEGLGLLVVVGARRLHMALLLFPSLPFPPR